MIQSWTWSQQFVYATLAAVIPVAGVGLTTVVQSPPHHHYPVRASVEHAAPAVPLVFTGVTVVDVTNGRLLPTRVVVIVGNRVTSVAPVGKSQIPAGARVIDGTGKYLIPGLWDMHAHVDDRVDQMYPRYIAHGVTGIREMAQRFRFGTDSFRVWQREVSAGTRVGPRSIGPSVDLDQFSGLSAGAIPRVLDSLKSSGIAFLKYHDDDGDPDLFFTWAREARRVGLPMLGHIPFPLPGKKVVTNVEASDSGFVSVEHINHNHQCWPQWLAPLGDSVAADRRCAPVARAYIRNGTWVVPTLTYMWHYPGWNVRSAAHFNDALRVVRMLRRLGVTRFLVGSDCCAAGENPLLHPGLTTVEEIIFLGKAGLTPLQALQAATLNPAIYLHGTDSLGTVAAGKLADLVLLDANPLADLHTLLKVRATVANGRYFDRAALDSLDPEGTRPDVGLVPVQERLERAYSAQFLAETDTTEVALTDDLLTRYSALWTDLNAFWREHEVLQDSAKAYADHPLISLLAPGVAGTKRATARQTFQQLTVFDYVSLTAKNPALADIFKKHGISPAEYWPIAVTLQKEVYRARLKEQLGDGAAAVLGSPGRYSTANRSIMDADAHWLDLSTMGLQYPRH